MCSTCVQFIQKQSHISGSKEGMLEKEVGMTWSVSWSLLNIRGLLCLFKPSFCMTCILCTFVHFMYLFYTKVSHYIHAYIIYCHFLRLRQMPPRGGFRLIRASAKNFDNLETVSFTQSPPKWLALLSIIMTFPFFCLLALCCVCFLLWIGSHYLNFITQPLTFNSVCTAAAHIYLRACLLRGEVILAYVQAAVCDKFTLSSDRKRVDSQSKQYQHQTVQLCFYLAPQISDERQIKGGGGNPCCKVLAKMHIEINDVVCWAQQLVTWSVGHSSWWRGLLGTAVGDVVCWAQQLMMWSVGLSNWRHGLLGWAVHDVVCWAQQLTTLSVGLSNWWHGLLGWAVHNVVCWAKQLTTLSVGLSSFSPHLSLVRWAL